ncbi:MAG: hypothetical protein U0271_18305 [Polyangiaceae bacterium]
MSARLRTSLATCLIWVGAGLLARAAAADDVAPVSEAQRLTTEARDALAAGRVDEACKKFDAAAVVERSAPNLVAAGECHELQGKTATAWRSYTAASVLASADGSTDLADRARSLAGKLAPHLSKLRIDVLSPAPDQAVWCDGAPVATTDWGALVPVDPGDHTVSSTASGFDPYRETVRVGADSDVRVVVVRLRKPGEDVQPPNPDGGQTTNPATPPPTGDGVVRSVDPITLTGFVTTSFGALGIVMGIAFGVMALQDVNQAEEDPALCPNKVCSTAGRSLIDEASTKGTISTVAFTVGGVALGAGVIVLVYQALTKPPAPTEAPKAVTVRPVGVGSAGLGVELAF